MRISKTITITSGTPIFLDGHALGSAPAAPVLANRCLITAAIGGTGNVSVLAMDAFLPTTTPNASTSGHLAAQLAPATSTAPGGSYSDAVNPEASGPIHIELMAVDGSHSGDTVIVTYDLRD